jgi:hypothetical protein
MALCYFNLLLLVKKSMHLISVWLLGKKKKNLEILVAVLSHIMDPRVWNHSFNYAW